MSDLKVELNSNQAVENASASETAGTIASVNINTSPTPLFSATSETAGTVATSSSSSSGFSMNA